MALTNNVLRKGSLLLAAIMLMEAMAPAVSFALTSGPSQPEVQGFEPAGTSEMVDLFSGDYSYNIPLLDVGGYPINISYKSGITSDQEASWVGLGWNVNMGVINRSMRAVPDDFNGDVIQKETHMKNNNTYGVNFYPEGELFGINLGKLGFNLGLKYNNYNGFGFEMGMNPSLTSSAGDKGGLTLGLGISAGSESGVGITPSVSYSQKVGKESSKENMSGGISLGFPYSSRAGLQSMTVGANMNRGKEGKISGNSSISFAGNSYTPSIGMPMMNVNLSLSATLGASFYGGHPEGRIKGYYAGQFLYINQRDVHAYGYMYAAEGNKDRNAMHDMNRERDGGYTEHTIGLPLTTYTYDVYSVNGQGIGGSYRPFRGDIGTVYDVETKNYNSGLDFPGIEIGAGGLVHMGIDFSVNQVNSKSGLWSEGNYMASVLNFSKSDPYNAGFEPYYFKQSGDKSADSDPDLFNKFGKFNAVRTNINHNTHATKAQVFNQAENTNQDITTNKRTVRQRRNEHITVLTADEANKVSRKVKVYAMNSFTVANNEYEHIEVVDRLSRPKHHTSEITSYRSDGARYIFGIPAYNNMQSEVSYGIGSINGTEDATGVTAQQPNKKDRFYEKTVTPGYAHSYLLTEVLSADYVDVTGDGPSEDDLGTYTKVNYSKMSTFKWRTPLVSSNVSPGMKADQKDNKANYVYGEKEIWYVHSIETKTHVAEFVLLDRMDGLGVLNETTGGIDASNKLKRLKKITLYSKKDRFKGGALNTSAIPIKCVQFEYDYSLCPDIANNSGQAVNQDGTPPAEMPECEVPGIVGLPIDPGEIDPDPEPVLLTGSNINACRGKLTLKRIYFTYGQSQKGKLNPYRFSYGENLHNGVVYNPSYNIKSNDRWGNYTQPSKTIGGVAVTPQEFPFTEQDQTLADKFASAWCLTSVKLPSGGIIKVYYEADDYAYVQDKRAMQMFSVHGMGDAPTGADLLPSNIGSVTYSGFDERRYVYFKLQNTIAYDVSKATATKYFGDRYLREAPTSGLMPTLYFKYLFKIDTDAGQVEEFVPGYIRGSDILSYGVCRTAGTNQPWTYGYVEVKSVTVDDPIPIGDASPFSHAAWNFVKLYLPRIAYNQPDVDDLPVMQIFESMRSTFSQIRQTAEGFNSYMRNRGMCNTFVPQKSFIRLYTPEYKKRGGGLRVKKILTSDEFQTMGGSGYTNAAYGQEYTYTKKDEYGNTISSGVAAYEPMLGGEENPFKQPIAKDDSKLRVPSDEHVQEAPFGETFFPGASVGYSQVTVKNLQYANVKKNATGKVVHEFYTARDFPTIVRSTGIDPARDKGNPVFKFLNISSIDHMAVSQGYCIELNDMHGKQKGQKVYQEFDDENPISGIEYKYAVDPANPKRLLNMALAIDAKGNINKNKDLIGYDYDIIADAREQSTKTVSGGLTGNLESFLAAIVPIVVPVPLPDYSQQSVRFRSMVITKVVNQYGIVTETTAFDDKANVKTENLLWDKETGEVLLTRTINNFEDPVYAFTYPAHWVYEGMGQAYKNTNVKTTVAAFESLGNQLFAKGDEVILGDEKLWVLETVPKVKLVDKHGQVVKPSDYDADDQITIVRSGRRNQQTSPIGKVTCLSNPLRDAGNDKLTLTFEDVVSAEATEFSDKGDLFCECGIIPGETVYNPFVKGTLGNWRSRKTYTYLTGRTQSKKNGNLNIRKDGTFSSFNPFWSFNGNAWGPSYDRWTFVSEASLYSPYGYSLEDKDALGRYSSAVYGYNHQLPITVSANSRYRETAFDNFEDYEYYDCDNFDRHFSFKRSLYKTGEGNVTGTCTLSTSRSHTGRSSLKISNGTSNIKLKKIIQPCAEE